MLTAQLPACMTMLSPTHIDNTTQSNVCFEAHNIYSSQEVVSYSGSNSKYYRLINIRKINRERGLIAKEQVTQGGNFFILYYILYYCALNLSASGNFF